MDPSSPVAHDPATNPASLNRAGRDDDSLDRASLDGAEPCGEDLIGLEQPIFPAHRPTGISSSPDHGSTNFGSPDPGSASWSRMATAVDDQLSQRFIALDPAGYFLIRVDAERGELVAEHYSNGIDERGLATDPETGEVLACRQAGPRSPVAIYRARTAKELGIALTEGEGPHPISRLDHALYLGRELQKAEAALFEGAPYVQD